MMNRFIILIFVVIVFAFSCKKPEKYSTTPAITFKEIPVKDTTIFSNHIKRCVLTYSLIDGDGDIGFNDGDTTYPYNIDGNYYNNVIIHMYKMVNGVYYPVDTPEIGTPFYFRTTYIEPIGQNKTLKCTIYINLDFDIPSAWDTVKFDFFMYDRALNKSNVESTPMVIL